MMMGLGFGGLGLIFMLVFWVVIIGLAVWFLGNLFPRATSGPALRTSPPAERYTPPTESPLDILKTRYARGEITREEYEETRRDLME